MLQELATLRSKLNEVKRQFTSRRSNNEIQSSDESDNDRSYNSEEIEDDMRGISSIEKEKDYKNDNKRADVLETQPKLKIVPQVKRKSLEKQQFSDETSRESNLDDNSKSLSDKKYLDERKNDGSTSNEISKSSDDESGSSREYKDKVRTLRNTTSALTGRLLSSNPGYTLPYSTTRPINHGFAGATGCNSHTQATAMTASRPHYDRMEADIVNIRQQLAALKSKTARYADSVAETSECSVTDRYPDTVRSEVVHGARREVIISKHASRSDRNREHVENDDLKVSCVESQPQSQIREEFKDELFSEDEEEKIELPEYLTDEEKLKNRVKQLQGEKRKLLAKTTILEDRLRMQQRGEVKKCRIMNLNSSCAKQYRTWMQAEAEKNKRLIKTFYKDK